MEAGRLRHRVTIQRKQVTRDSFGGEVVAWKDVATVWAAIEPLRGREYLEAQQARAEVTTRIRMRYLPDVVPSMRVVRGGRVWEIESVINVDERNRELHLMCREVL